MPDTIKDIKSRDTCSRSRALTGSVPTKAEVLKAIYESGVHQENPTMIFWLRRNGKLVEEPSAYAMAFARRLAENPEPRQPDHECSK